MKGTIPLDSIDAAALTDYAGIVGHLLAKGHARTSGASMIAGYVGRGDKLDEAMAGSPRRTPTRPRRTTPRSWPPRGRRAADRGGRPGPGGSAFRALIARAARELGQVCLGRQR